MPKRDTNLFADESGGIAESAQQQIRDALVTVLGEISSGQREMPSPPTTELFTRMMSLCVAEEVEPEYAPMSEEDVKAAVQDIITQVGAAGLGDLGKVMGMATKQLAGQADGKVISAIAKTLLSA